MNMEDWVRAVFGSFVLISVSLGHFHHPYWLFFTAFIRLNLLQSAFTKWRLMENVLEKLGFARRCF